MSAENSWKEFGKEPLNGLFWVRGTCPETDGDMNNHGEMVWWYTGNSVPFVSLVYLEFDPADPGALSAYPVNEHETGDFGDDYCITHVMAFKKPEYATPQKGPEKAPKKARRIVCAACRHRETGKIVAGIRHWDDIMRGQVEEDADGTEWEQGFLDNKREFLSRTEAWKVAVSANQLVSRCGGDSSNGGTLYSENLY